MKNTKFSPRVITFFLMVSVLVTTIPINSIYAGNNGPNAPEASAFEPVNATDMVNLSSGDLSYVLPLLEIDGFPVTLSYHAGIPMDMEASWVGLGWNINTGAIARGVVANPDDWGIGRRVHLTYLQGEIDSYSVNVGIGFGKAAEVGVGLSWGSNKSISGSVSAGVGPLSASMDTNGNYSVGVTTDVFTKGSMGGESGDSPFGGSLSISGNVSKGGIAVGLGVGVSSENVSVGMGVSISGQGVGSSFSVGGGNASGSGGSKTGGKGGASISMNSFSAGDYSYNTKGFYIPLQIGIFSFGFGHQKTKISLKNAYNKYASGSLYHNLDDLYESDLGGGEYLPNTVDVSLIDFQKRNVYGDVYEQELPVGEIDFISDTRKSPEKQNFTFSGYDSYDINATGLGGALKPIIGQNTVLISEGYDGNTVHPWRDKAKVFYHNANGSLKPDKQITLNNNDPNKLSFSFDGQITENAIVSDASLINHTGAGVFDVNNFINEGNSISNRPNSGSYIETFTNAEIDAGANIMIPASLKTDTGVISRNSQGYTMDGIGGYRVITPDGKTYHFSQPVYQYETVEHSFLNFEAADDVSEYNSNSKRQATPYATHWLLTAITGPDFIDVNNNRFPDENDYGYWLRLDHGQWSNAYTWRSPYDIKEYQKDDNITQIPKSRKNYSTFMDGEVEKSDPGQFMQGRKDLYYLDKIVSKNQSAIFVKDLRYDGYGTSADYEYSPNHYFKNKIDGGYNTNYTELARYEMEYQLRLDKIIILNKKENEYNINKSEGNGVLKNITQTVLPNASNSLPRYFDYGFFDSHLPANCKTHRLHLSNNVIDVNDVQNFDYSEAYKVIKFNYSYDLAKASPSSGYLNNVNGYPNLPDSSNPNNENYGKLTLESIKTYGRGNVPNANENQLYDYMPPYVFDYYNRGDLYEENTLEFISYSSPNPFLNTKPQYRFDRANKDNWGFRGNNIEAWSLKSITTPQGSSIDMVYEEDEFHVEAFARRYWENGLLFRFIQDPNGGSGEPHQLIVANDPRYNDEIRVDFRDYFDENEIAYINITTYYDAGSGADGGIEAVGGYNVSSVSEHSITLDLGNAYAQNRDGWWKSRDKYWTNGKCSAIVFDGSSESAFFSAYNSDYPCFIDSPIPFCFDVTREKRYYDDNGSDDENSLWYRLLANKVPPGTSGGGLRVKDIIVNDDSGAEYITRYDYNDPYKGRTSGITSFNPIRGEVFVPYQNELPGPGVMYEWVTMTAIEKKGAVEKEVGKTRYRYYTLNPVLDIFNPNMDMKDIDGESIFKATVDDPVMSLDKLQAADITIEKNLTKIGQLISIESFNESGHLTSKTTNTYGERVGELSETFSSMKTVFDFDEDEDGNESNYHLRNHYLTLSTKSEKVSVLKSIENVTPLGTNSIKYSNPDPYLGTYTTSIRQSSDGTYIKEEKIPAYSKYPEMGSKIVDDTFENMLTQEAINVVSWSNTETSYSWKTLDANITTWKDSWNYRNIEGGESTQSGIYRKHKSYVWKDDIDPDSGEYLDAVYANNYNFNWSTGQPTSDKWQNTAEITRYTHWSSPIETRDINNNYLASKMDGDYSKVVASGNAGYTEIFASGAEYRIGDVYLDQQIKGAGYRSTDYAHTGDYSLKIKSGDKGFEAQMHGDDYSKDNYKISVWLHKNNGNLKLNINGNTTEFNGEKINAGDWTLYNHYEFLDGGAQNISVTSGSGDIYVDDFRIHPVYATINTYVYDINTDELSYILDANNLATKYIYDNAGRLCRVYKEVETNAPATDGGFKLVNQYKYHYQSIANSNDCNCCDNDNQNSNPEYSPLVIKSIKEVDKGAYKRVFDPEVSGGSGDYTYEWRWLTDFDSNTYSNYIVNNGKQEVPFAIKMCDIKENTFNKIWHVELKVTDNITGEIEISTEKVELSDCKSVLSESNWADLEISTNYDPCDAQTKYTFKPFVIKPEHNDYSYLYQTYNHSTDLWSGFTVISSAKNNFCGDIYYAPSSKCDKEFSLYQTIQYRIIDNITGDIFQSNVIDVYLECADDPAAGTKLDTSEYHDKHNAFGSVVEKSATGEVILTYNFTDKINNKN